MFFGGGGCLRRHDTVEEGYVFLLGDPGACRSVSVELLSLGGCLCFEGLCGNEPPLRCAEVGCLFL